jgi:drug/metabolite transporter (DMT)-like permease
MTLYESGAILFRQSWPLLLVPALWGWGYPLIRGSLADSGPFSFLLWRFAFALVPLAVVCGPALRGAGRPAWRGGVVTGITLFLAYATLNLGLVYTTTANAGFVIGLRVVLVPVLGAIWFGLQVAGISWFAAALSLVGLAFIAFAVTDGVAGPNPGDMIMLASAACFALHVLLVDRQARKVAAAPLLLIQIGTVVVLSAPAALLLDAQPWPAAPSVWWNAALAGLFATALAFWLQVRYQPRTTADRSGIVFSSEPLFAALFGYLYLGERLHGWQWLGAGFIVAAMLLVNVPGRDSRAAARKEEPCTPTPGT